MKFTIPTCLFQWDEIPILSRVSAMTSCPLWYHRMAGGSSWGWTIFRMRHWSLSSLPAWTPRSWLPGMAAVASANKKFMSLCLIFCCKFHLLSLNLVMKSKVILSLDSRKFCSWDKHLVWFSFTKRGEEDSNTYVYTNLLTKINCSVVYHDSSILAERIIRSLLITFFKRITQTGWVWKRSKVTEPLIRT